MKRVLYFFVTVSGLSLAACQHQESHVPAMITKPLAACTGEAPKGELVATRVTSANPTRSKPGLYEGPVWIKDALYFSDFTFSKNDPARIQRLDSKGVMTTAFNDTGSNGLAVDAQGNLMVAAQDFKTIVHLDMASGKRTQRVKMYNGHDFFGPNDLALASDGAVYFIDPNFKRDPDADAQPNTSVYRASKDGVVTLVDSTIANPNGVALSPNGDTLYVSGGGKQGLVRAYPIVKGIPQAGTDVIPSVVSPDGMVVDCQGNIYVAENNLQRVHVYTNKGESLAIIKTDANTTNAAFGGESGKTLYITGLDAIWKVDLNITGSPY